MRLELFSELGPWDLVQGFRVNRRFSVWILGQRFRLRGLETRVACCRRMQPKSGRIRI